MQLTTYLAKLFNATGTCCGWPYHAVGLVCPGAVKKYTETQHILLDFTTKALDPG